mgnify:CR=1 FL=1
MKKKLFTTLVFAAASSTALCPLEAKASPWKSASATKQLDQAKRSNDKKEKINLEPATNLIES